MVNIKVTVDTSKTDKYFRKVGKSMEGGMNRVLDKELEKIIRLSKMLAPVDTGALRRGIMLGRTSKTKKIKRGFIEWQELNSRRGQGFAKTSYEDFVTWMHTSPEALTRVRWRRGVPNFFDVATEMARKDVYKGVKLTVDRAIKQ